MDENKNLSKVYDPSQVEEKWYQVWEENKYFQEFEKAMDEDFNTSKALSILFELANNAQREKETNKEEALKSAGLLIGISNVLGFDFAKEETLGDDLTESLMELIIEIRKMARTQKNWELSDKIRDDLAKLNIVLKDNKDGKTTFEVKK